MKSTKLSIVVPCYNEEDVLQETCSRLQTILVDLVRKKMIHKDSFILFVNDGSKDKTWDIISKLAKKYNKIKGLKFSRNFGHQNALLAGLIFSKDKSDCVLSIDADLQQDENAIYSFLEKFEQGYEIVNGVRINRETDSFLKKFSATFFYKLMKLMGVEIIENSADYRLLSSRVIQELDKFGEVNLFLRGLFPILGFKTTTVDHIVRERFAGKSKYSLKKMLMFAWNGITSFSIMPIRVVTVLGLVVFFLSCVMSLYVLVMFFLNQTVSGWASTVLPIYFLGGIQLFGIGLVGEYVGKSYMEIKRRPRYIIDETI